MNCRSCKKPLNHTFVDLGFAPPSNAYLSAGDLNAPEIHFPLRVLLCESCWLVQTDDHAEASALFSHDYAYFSSTSKGWLAHAEKYTFQMCELLGLSQDSFVIEVASNDGYLLRNFVARGIPCLGIEPTLSTATAAEAIGVRVLKEFFGEDLGARLASKGQVADLIAGNNVYAHVPDINDFTRGLARALKPEGIITLEFPHLLELLRHFQFDTIYHEHYSYLSLHAARYVFEAAGLRIWRVETLPTHGGSLRIFGCHAKSSWPEHSSVAEILRAEIDAGVCNLQTYWGFQKKVEAIKDNLLRFLIEQKRSGLKVAAYGAAAKGNTLLNFAGIRPDLLPYVCDAAPAKQGKFMPGSHIPILAPTAIREHRPDIVLILPWNIADEVRAQLGYIREWGGRFAIAVPDLVAS